MDIGILAFFSSMGLIVLAEMGDKTQLLAMAFATKYKAAKVLIGVFIATVLNHALAVAVGTFLAGSRFQSIQVWIQAVAALSFIFFGLWTIRGDKLEGEENRKTKFGAVITVAIAFFIAEMGDKTQLTTISLATQFPLNPVIILFATTCGMIIADAIGIIVGVVMCKKIPERIVKLISAGVFVFFGFLKSYDIAKENLKLDSTALIILMISLITITCLLAWYLIRKDLQHKKEANETCIKKNK